MLGTASASEAAAFIASAGFVWHQRFELAPGVWTPGVSSVNFLLDTAGVPADLTGLSVLDVGTTNGGCAFEAERRGARRVVAADIATQELYGFRAIRKFLDSRVEFVQASVYELPDRLNEPFDLVFFVRVRYHLPHPLLAPGRPGEIPGREILRAPAMLKWWCRVRSLLGRESRCWPRETTSRTATPVKSVVASEGTRNSDRVSTRPASTSFSRWHARQTVSPSGTASLCRAHALTVKQRTPAS